MGKWWYVRHFLGRLVPEYDYVLAVDSDLGFDFSLDDYFDSMARYGVAVSQPATVDPWTWAWGRQTYGGPLEGRGFPEGDFTGRWTTYVECGPWSAYSAEAFACLRPLILAPATTGYGLDMVSCLGIAARCGYDPHKTCAVLYNFRMEHHDSKEASKQAAFLERANAESRLYWEATGDFYADVPSTFTGEVF
eukprot:NODE_3671_length_757_cov_267.854701.p1 GENE.NODE_3671_length_757_cov_267.854701~~NODE_3671_length_757_cov_267.854701.p1  ORF type:complete len:192 (-),score=41.25 NODE_3671_length_757_cov_267.854701:164-739(-)